MLRDAKRLHDLGFALIPLRAKSKMPLENGWSKGPRKTLNELKSLTKPGMNLGVRLGEASVVLQKTNYHRLANYLAVIDCDVKGTEARHTEEMLAKLAELFGGVLEKAPQVASGRGNGSRHYYVVTASPAQTHHIYKSEEKVTLTMNGKKVQRPAWEISILGEGAQSVLPPSVHPDSGKQYKWVRPIGLEGFPLIELSSFSYQKHDKTPETSSTEPFVREEIPAKLRARIPKEALALIEDGEGSSDDKSIDLFSVSKTLWRCGLNANQIATMLSDPNTYLGEAACRRRGTAGAPEWLLKYTIMPAKADALDLELFADVVPQPPVKRTPEEEKASMKENWKSELDRSDKGRVLESLKNLVLILESEGGGAPFKKDLFKGVEINSGTLPWGGDGEVKDIDLVNIKVWISRFYGFEPTQSLIIEAMQYLANKHRFHPVVEWLEALPPWDGIPRTATWLKRLMSASGPEKYIEAISRKILVAMIKRVYEPGCKFDYVPVFVGDQGIRKSTAVAALAHKWGSDAHLDITDKDGVLALRGAWILELGEMSAMGKQEVNRVKEFVTRATDRIRLPYGKLFQEFPRQTVFVGTTNNEEFLKDETGNRRFWPIPVTKCDPDGIVKEHTQLFAEALVWYRLGEELFLDPTEEAEAKQIQEMHLIGDILKDQLADFLAQKHENFDNRCFTLSELFKAWKSIPSSNYMPEDKGTQMRICTHLKSLGYSKERKWDSENRKSYFWVKARKGRGGQVSADKMN